MWWHLFHHSAVNIREGRNLLLNLDVNIDGFSIHSCDKCGYLLDEDKCYILHSLPELEKKVSSDVTMTLIYIACF